MKLAVKTRNSRLLQCMTEIIRTKMSERSQKTEWKYRLSPKLVEVVDTLERRAAIQRTWQAGEMSCQKSHEVELRKTPSPAYGEEQPMQSAGYTFSRWKAKRERPLGPGGHQAVCDIRLCPGIKKTKSILRFSRKALPTGGGNRSFTSSLHPWDAHVWSGVMGPVLAHPSKRSSKGPLK